MVWNSKGCEAPLPGLKPLPHGLADGKHIFHRDIGYEARPPAMAPDIERLPAP